MNDEDGEKEFESWVSVEGESDVRKNDEREEGIVGWKK